MVILMIKINYMFSIGHRCHSVNFLKEYNLRKISGPFDHLFIDIETVFLNIHTQFIDYLSNIVLINKQKNIQSINYSESNGVIDEKLLALNNSKNICYMSHNYNNVSLLINQNFIDNVENNLYDWNRICIFLHHNILLKENYNIIHKRVTIFNNIYNNEPNATCLFYISKIIIIDNLEDYKQHIIQLKIKYNINCYIICIICSSNLNECVSFDCDILFIVKNVKNYDIQYNSGPGVDNELNYSKELHIIKSYFNMELLEYDDIKAKY